MANSDVFQAAVAKSRNISSKPSTDDLLMLYALYKQATEGDVTGDRPSGWDFKAAAKYDAWAKLKGKSAQEAEQAYVALVDRLHG